MWNVKALFAPAFSHYEGQELTLSQLRSFFGKIYEKHFREIPPEFSANDLLSIAKKMGYVVKVGGGKYRLDTSEVEKQ